MPPDTSFTAQVEWLADVSPRLLGRALRTGGAYADLFYEATTQHHLSWQQRAGRKAVVSEQNRRAIQGLGVRVIADEQVGFAATEAGSLAACLTAADEAAACIDGLQAMRRPPDQHIASIHLDLPPDAPDAIGRAEKLAVMQAAAEAAFSLDERVEQVAMGYHDRVRRTAVATADGLLRATAGLLLGLRIEVTLAAPHGLVKAHAMTGGACGFGHFFASPPEVLAREAVERAQRLAEARPLTSGKRPIVLAAGWGGVWLHEAVGHLLEADTVATGGSPFAERLGQTVASSAITLVDDATLPEGRGSYVFDDEGTPAARTTLIEEGVLQGFLTDRLAAARLGLPSTGNARRQGYQYAPLPRMTNLVLAPADIAPADLISAVDDGLYVQTIGQGVVHPGGQFSFEVHEGYRIEQGRRTVPVTGVQLRGEAATVLQSVDGVGSDPVIDTARGFCKKAGQVVPISVGMPTVLIRAMDVVGGSV